VRLVPDLHELWSYINPFMLYGRHMAIGAISRASGGARSESGRAVHEMERMKNEAAGFMKVARSLAFFEAEAEGETLRLFAARRENRCRPGVQRQKTGDQLCLSDYVLDPKDGKRDTWPCLW